MTLSEQIASQAAPVSSQVAYGRAILYALVLKGKHVYAGTVSPTEKARRRKANKAARVARRVSRSRA